MQETHFLGPEYFNSKSREVIRLALNMRLNDEPSPVADLPWARLFVVVFARVMKSCAINQDVVSLLRILLRIVFKWLIPFMKVLYEVNLAAEELRSVFGLEHVAPRLVLLFFLILGLE